MPARLLLVLTGTLALLVGSGCFGYDESDSEEIASEDGDEDLESLQVADDGPRVCSTWMGVMTTPVEPLRVRATLCEYEETGEVHGNLRWQGERTGSGLHEIGGNWSEDGTRLSLLDLRVAVETLRPPGASFGAIDSYDLTLSGDMLAGSFQSDDGSLLGGVSLRFVESTRIGTPT